MDLSSHQIVMDVVQFAAVTVLAFAVICVVMSLLRGQKQPDPTQTPNVPDHVPPELSLDAHLDRWLAAQQVGHAEFSLLLIATRPTDDDTVRTAETVLRRNLRSTDSILRISADRLAAVINAGHSRAVAAIELLQSHAAAAGINMIIGLAVCPEMGARASVLRSGAEIALQEAIEKGVTLWSTSGDPTSDAEDVSDTTTSSSQNDSSLDELTRVLRSDRIAPALQKFITKHRADGRPVSVLQLDVDFLRRYNEQYGQEAGDLLLRSLGVFLRRQLRPADMIGRSGGDEFVVALGCDAPSALGVAQRLLSSLRKMTFMSGKVALKMSLCIGAAGAPEHGTTAKQLMDHAFVALRAAKGRGHGSAALYDPAAPPPRKVAEQTDVF